MEDLKEWLSDINHDYEVGVALFGKYSRNRHFQSAELSAEKQRILERWRVGSALLRQHPQKMKAARLLKERFPDISILWHNIF